MKEDKENTVIVVYHVIRYLGGEGIDMDIYCGARGAKSWTADTDGGDMVSHSHRNTARCLGSNTGRSSATNPWRHDTWVSQKRKKAGKKQESLYMASNEPLVASERESMTM